MKKLVFVCGLFLFALASPSSAQYTVTMEDVLISSVKINEGTNSIPVPGNKGTIKLVKRNGKFTSAEFVDSLGKKMVLYMRKSGANGLPAPSCKYPLPDACFGGPQNIGMCICKPTDLTTGEPESYTIALLLPAVQKVREAAARM